MCEFDPGYGEQRAVNEAVRLDEQELSLAADERAADEAEYQRGVSDTKRAQEAGPAGSEEREAAYREMEAQWEREGFDG